MAKDKITTTAEELAVMPLDEKIKRYAEDVMKTEEEYTENNRTAYRYDFLFGAGSLGYPIGQSSPAGRKVKTIAGKLGLQVWWNMENSYANFNGKITQKSIEEEFRPIWEESERLKAEDKAK